MQTLREPGLFDGRYLRGLTKQVIADCQDFRLVPHDLMPAIVRRAAKRGIVLSESEASEMIRNECRRRQFEK